MICLQFDNLAARCAAVYRNSNKIPALRGYSHRGKSATLDISAIGDDGGGYPVAMTRQRLRANGMALLLVVMTCLWGVQAMGADGLTTIASSHGPKQTMDRLVAAVKAKGLTVFARIDHAAGAAEVGLPLRPSELLVFGNARGGTPLMQAAQTIGIDLPLKVLVWQDEQGKTWLSYNEPAWLAQRHRIEPESVPAVKAITALLNAVAKEAASE